MHIAVLGAGVVGVDDGLSAAAGRPQGHAGRSRRRARIVHQLCQCRTGGARARLCLGVAAGARHDAAQPVAQRSGDPPAADLQPLRSGRGWRSSLPSARTSARPRLPPSRRGSAPIRSRSCTRWSPIPAFATTPTAAASSISIAPRRGSRPPPQRADILRRQGLVIDRSTGTAELVACDPGLARAAADIAGALFARGDESGDAMLFTRALADVCVARGMTFRSRHHDHRHRSARRQCHRGCQRPRTDHRRRLCAGARRPLAAAASAVLESACRSIRSRATR